MKYRAAFSTAILTPAKGTVCLLTHVMVDLRVCTAIITLTEESVGLIFSPAGLPFTAIITLTEKPVGRDCYFSVNSFQLWFLRSL